MVRVGCDIGGTFTDFVVLDEASGEIFVEKALTTPADPSIGLLDGLGALGRAAPGYAARTRRLAHATTLIANAVIERKGARTALLATRGFRDVLELRRHVRVTTYELWADPPEPLVERALRLPVSERTWSDGRILTRVDPAEIAEIAAVLPPPAPISMRCTAGTATGKPLDFTNRLERATSSSLVIGSAPSRMRQALAVVPPMSKASTSGSFITSE